MNPSQSLLFKKLAFRLHYFFLRGRGDLDLATDASTILLALPPAAPGNPRDGESLLLHRFLFYGEPHDLTGLPALNPAQASPYWLMEFHGFAWIKHLLAFNRSVIAGGHLRDYLYRWIEHSARMPVIARHPIVMGERVASWVRYSHAILDGASLLFTRHFIRSLAQQAYSLHESLERRGGASGFSAIKGVLFASVLLPDAAYMQVTALRTLEDALETQIVADGGHISRSPSLHVRQFEQLLEIRQLLKHMRLDVPSAVNDALARMAGMLKFLMHGDLGLALFNDSIEENPLWLSTLLNHVALARKPLRAEQSRFESLQAGETRLLMDVGIPDAASSHSFPGTLSFELSDNGERLVVNCGAYRGARKEWRKVCKSTAAHTMLTLDDRTIFLAPVAGAPVVEVRHAGGAVIEASHNGYEAPYGIVHTRRVSLSEDGGKLSGTDSLVRTRVLEGASTVPLHVRFHLHPQAKPRCSANSTWEVLLPSGKVWEFTCPAKESVLVEVSVYLGNNGRPEKTHQLVIEGTLGGEQEKRIEWTFERKPQT